MKTISIITTIVFVLTFSNCRKPETKADNRVILTNKSIEEIRNLISGNWQIKREYQKISGIAGTTVLDTTYVNNTGERIRFKSNDTINWTSNDGNIIYKYEKASVSKQRNYQGIEDYTIIGDSIYHFKFLNYPYDWLMLETKNDTLIIYKDLKLTYLKRF